MIKNKINPDEECAICIEDINNGKRVQLNCRHVFHRQCMFKMFLSEMSRCGPYRCPLCREHIHYARLMTNTWYKITEKYLVPKKYGQKNTFN